MKSISKSLSVNHKLLKIVEGIKVITIPGAAQLIIQILGLVGGIIIIRLLPTKEYAFYTIANTMLGTMMLLADGGISTGVMAEGAQVWQNREKLGRVIVTGLNLRKKFAVIILILIAPVLVYLLKHNGASWLMCFLITISIIPAFAADLSDSLLEIAPKLSQRLNELQKNYIQASIGRLLMVSVLLFIFPWTYIALFATGIPRFWANIKLKKITTKYADLTTKPDAAISKSIMNMVKRILPVAVYNCFSGQVTIWLISIFGSTLAVAKVGALGRISMLLNFVAGMFGLVITPRFARMPNLSGLLLKRLIYILMGLSGLCTIIILAVYIFPEPLLWILGAKYANLKTELVLSITGTCIGLMTGSIFGLALSRGWTLNPVLSIIVSVVAIVLGYLFINISTLKGIFYFNIFIALFEFIMHLVHILYRVVILKKVHLTAA